MLNARRKKVNHGYNRGKFYKLVYNLIQKKEGQLRSAVWDYTPQEWINGNFRLTHKGFSLYDKSIFTLSYQNFKEGRRDRDFGDTILYETKEKVNAYTSALDFIKKFGKSKLFYGLEYVYNKVNSVGKQSNLGNGATSETSPRYPDDSNWQSMAAYVSLQSKLSANLYIQLGLRYNHILLYANYNNDFYGLVIAHGEVILQLAQA